MFEQEENLAKAFNNALNNLWEETTKQIQNEIKKSLQAFGIWKPKAETSNFGTEEIKHIKPRGIRTVWQRSLPSYPHKPTNQVMMH